MKLAVPYYSQYTDVNDEYWTRRACGFCCIKMVAEYQGVVLATVEELAREAKKNGGYSENGIIHDYAVNFFKKIGLSSHREEKMEEKKGVSKLISFLENNNPVIVSLAIEKEGKKLFHQVVIVGFEGEVSNPRGFYIHDPAASYKGSGAYLFMDMGEFISKWRRMVIFVER